MLGKAAMIAVLLAPTASIARHDDHSTAAKPARWFNVAPVLPRRTDAPHLRRPHRSYRRHWMPSMRAANSVFTLPLAGRVASEASRVGVVRTPTPNPSPAEVGSTRFRPA